jgi:hypothetical protein
MKNYMTKIFKVTVIVVVCGLLSSCSKYLGDPTNSSPNEADAQKFIDSAGITDVTQRFAINNLVKQLKDSALWTKFGAIYPLVGGTSASMKWNLKDPRDLDLAYRLTFYGSPTYAPTGVLFPTSADYADTHLSDAVLTYNDNSISYCSRTQNTVSGYDMGCYDHGAPYNELTIYNQSDAANWFGYYNFRPMPPSTRGLFTLSATANDVTRYENGVVKNSKGAPPLAGSTGYTILLGFVNGASAGGQRECSLAAIGNGLTSAQAATFFYIVQNFVNELGR